MFGSEVLDTAVGLVFVFLLASLLATIANELIAALLLSRAKWLRYGIARLIGADWAARFYAHPLIAGSSTREAKPAHTTGARREWRGSGPSYVPSRAFADVLLHLVQAQDTTLQKIRTALRATLDAAPSTYPHVDALLAAATSAARGAAPASRAQTIVNDLERRCAETRERLVARWLAGLSQRAATAADPAFQPARAALADLSLVAPHLPIDELSARAQSIEAAIHATADGKALAHDLALSRARLGTPAFAQDAAADLRRFVDGMPQRYLAQTIDRLPEGQLRGVLRVLLDDAGADAERLGQNVEHWFDQAMDRVSGWYKRRTQWVVALLGIVLAVGLNVDTLAIVDYLSTHAGVRQALVDHAKAYSVNPDGGGADQQPQVYHLSARLRPTDENGNDADAPSSAVPADEFSRTRQELATLGLPIGWVRQNPSDEDLVGYRVLDASNVAETIEYHWLGWLITALATTVGAPFWFDLLNRVIALRATGKAPEQRPRPPKAAPQPQGPGGRDPG